GPELDRREIRGAHSRGGKAFCRGGRGYARTPARSDGSGLLRGVRVERRDTRFFARGRRSIDALDAVEQPAIPYRERPFPDFPEPGRSVGREKDELGFPDQVLRRYIANS